MNQPSHKRRKLNHRIKTITQEKGTKTQIWNHNTIERELITELEPKQNRRELYYRWNIIEGGGKECHRERKEGIS